MRFYIALAALALALVPVAAQASVTVTISAATVQATTVGGAVTETFDAKALGAYSTLSTAVGTITDSTGQFQILAADQYGGAGGTGHYMAIGAQSGSGAPATLTVSTPSATYFGFWLSALDTNNQILVYSGATLEATITQATIDSVVGASGPYYGNPTAPFLGQDVSEPFQYININATADTPITSVQFYNSGQTGTGLELDNLSVTASSPVPLPPAAISGLVALLLTGCAVAFRRASATAC